MTIASRLCRGHVREHRNGMTGHLCDALCQSYTIKATMASRRKNQLWYIVVGLLAFCVAVDHQCSSQELAIWQYFMSLHSDIYWFPYVNDVIRCCFLWHFHHLCALRSLAFFFFHFANNILWLFSMFNILFIFPCFTFNFVPKTFFLTKSMETQIKLFLIFKNYKNPQNHPNK